MEGAMYDLRPIIEQAQVFVSQHVPPALLERTLLIPLVFLVAGIGLSVLGAKLARPGLTTVFGAFGAYGGVLFAQAAGFAWPLGALIGAAMAATIGFLTFRVWVGTVTALVLTSLSLGAFGYQRVAPHLSEFDHVATWSPTTGTAEFAIPTPAEQQAYRDRSPAQWVERFWKFVTDKDASIQKNGGLLTAGVLVAGLFLGVVAMRWMLILSTSLLGTFLLITAVMTFLANRMQDSYQAFQSHSQIIGMGVGGLLVTSLIVQTLLTRKAPSEKERAAA